MRGRVVARPRPAAPAAGARRRQRQRSPLGARAARALRARARRPPGPRSCLRRAAPERAGLRPRDQGRADDRRSRGLRHHPRGGTWPRACPTASGRGDEAERSATRAAGRRGLGRRRGAYRDGAGGDAGQPPALPLAGRAGRPRPWARGQAGQGPRQLRGGGRAAPVGARRRPARGPRDRWRRRSRVPTRRPRHTRPWSPGPTTTTRRGCATCSTRRRPSSCVAGAGRRCCAACGCDRPWPSSAPGGRRPTVWRWRGCSARGSRVPGSTS